MTNNILDEAIDNFVSQCRGNEDRKSFLVSFFAEYLKRDLSIGEKEEMIAALQRSSFRSM